MTDLTGTIQARDTRSDVDPQLWNDILRNLDGALSRGAELRYRERWLFHLDLFGSKLSSHAEAGPFPVSFGPRSFSRELRGRNLTIPVETRPGTIEVPVRVDPGTLRVDVPRVETAIGPFDVESPPIEVPEFTVTSSLSGGRVRVGGDRIPARTQAIGTVRLPGLEFGGTRFGGTDVDEEASTWWLDPLVGLRVGADLSDRVSFVVAGNVGGFDLGSASKFSWEALAYLDWRFGETTSAVLGYRGLGVDRRRGDTQADITLHGPVVGVLFRY